MEKIKSLVKSSVEKDLDLRGREVALGEREKGTRIERETAKIKKNKFLSKNQITKNKAEFYQLIYLNHLDVFLLYRSTRT